MAFLKILVGIAGLVAYGFASWNLPASIGAHFVAVIVLGAPSMAMVLESTAKLFGLTRYGGNRDLEV